MASKLAVSENPLWDAEWVEGDWEADFSDLDASTSFSRQDTTPGRIETNTSRDHDLHGRRSASLVAATSSSKAIATGHKRFQEWKLRRRGSSATNSSNRIPLNTVTPKKGLTPEVACKPEAQQSDGGESDKENRQLINDGTGVHDESSFEELQVSYAAMSLAPSTPSSPESTAHHAAACVEHLVDRDGGGKSWEDYESEGVLSQMVDKSAPVKWKLSLPIWPITVEVAVDVKRTISDPFHPPARLADPELGDGTRSISAEQSPAQILGRWYEALEFDFGFSDVEAPA